MTTTTHSQVHQVQLAHPDVLLAVRALLTALDGDGEDGVRARRVLVHVGGPHRSCFV